MQDNLGIAPDIGFAGFADAIEQFEESLALELGQGLANRLADDLPLADQVLVSSIGQLEDVTRLAKQGHETRSLIEHQREKLMFWQEVSPHFTTRFRKCRGDGFG